MFEHTTFEVFDIQRFPLVTVRNDAIEAGYAAQWTREMDWLIAHGKPFVMLYVETPANETQEDFKRRGQWLKQNREALARVCTMVISVEPDEGRREEARVRGRGATKAFGIPHRAVGTLAEALDLASYRTAPSTSSGRWGAGSA